MYTPQSVISKYAETVVPLLRGGGPLLKERWGKAGTTVQKSADVLDIATETDVVIEKRMREELGKVYPGISFVGEETGGNRGERFWLMDPIDGTVQFSKGEKGCTSMIALVESGAVTFSAIYDFLDDVMYWAERGKGAYRERERLTVSTHGTLGGARIFWEMDLDKGANKKSFDRLNAVADLTKWVAAGSELVRVASGAYDARICIDPFGRDYDFAPGSLLVSEAGGIITNLGSHTYDYQNLNFIAGNPAIYEILTRGPNALFPIPRNTV